MEDFIKENSGVRFEEGLPLPYVKYEYGIWIIEFGDGKGTFKVCECFRESVNNQIKHKEMEYNQIYGDNSWNEYFKKGWLGNYYMNLYRRFLKGYDYESNICHRCNGKTPSIIYCNPIYGGKFKQTFGWYIERKVWNNELDEDERIVFEENQNRLNELNDNRNKLVKKHSNQYGVLPESIFQITYEIEKECGKLSRRNDNIIENLVRGEFGYKPIGEMWVNETILFKLVKEMFPKSVVIHHYRGSELEGLEIDVFIKDKKIGFEYNGLQHYKPIKHFGGEESLKKTKERDKRKIELCESLGIELHIIKYDETISKNLIKSRLNHT
jgi:hypothetical protein